MKEPAFYTIDETHLEDLKFVAKRLRDYVTQMSPEEMREASYRVMSVVRYTESIQALRGARELYVHLFPKEPEQKKPDTEALACAIADEWLKPDGIMRDGVRDLFGEDAGSLPDLLDRIVGATHLSPLRRVRP